MQTEREPRVRISSAGNFRVTFEPGAWRQRIFAQQLETINSMTVPLGLRVGARVCVVGSSSSK